MVANERIRTLLITLEHAQHHDHGVSGGGADYARGVAAAMAIEQYVDVYQDKRYGGYEDMSTMVARSSTQI